MQTRDGRGKTIDNGTQATDAADPGRTARTNALDAPGAPRASGLLMRAARDGNGVADGAGEHVDRAAKSSGAPLPTGIMRKFESSLGADLSGVRVHTGDDSVAAADAVGAKAYTTGNDIHFGAGHYDPSSPAGEHLLAHEVAHTVQQAGGTRYKLEVSSPGDAVEHEADRAADRMVAGARASIASSSTTLSRDVTDKPAPATGAPPQPADPSPTPTEKKTKKIYYGFAGPMGEGTALKRNDLGDGLRQAIIATGAFNDVAPGDGIFSHISGFADAGKWKKTGNQTMDHACILKVDPHSMVLGLAKFQANYSISVTATMTPAFTSTTVEVDDTDPAGKATFTTGTGTAETSASGTSQQGTATSSAGGEVGGEVGKESKGNAKVSAGTGSAGTSGTTNTGTSGTSGSEQAQYEANTLDFVTTMVYSISISRTVDRTEEQEKKDDRNNTVDTVIGFVPFVGLAPGIAMAKRKELNDSMIGNKSWSWGMATVIEVTVDRKLCKKIG